LILDVAFSCFFDFILADAAFRRILGFDSPQPWFNRTLPIPAPMSQLLRVLVIFGLFDFPTADHFSQSVAAVNKKSVK
jgi:hypothetical protein